MSRVVCFAGGGEWQRPGRRRVFITALLAIELLMVATRVATRALQEQQPAAVPPPESLDLGVTGLANMTGKGEGNPKIDSILRSEIAQREGTQLQAVETIEVEISIAAGSADAGSAAVTAAGGTVRIASRDGQLLQVLLPVNTIERADIIHDVAQRASLEPGLASQHYTLGLGLFRQKGVESTLAAERKNMLRASDPCPRSTTAHCATLGAEELKGLTHFAVNVTIFVALLATATVITMYQFKGEVPSGPAALY